MNADPVIHRVDSTRLVAVVALLAALGVLALSAGRIPALPTDPTAWPGWWSETDPALALGSVLRALAALGAAYLLVVTLLDLVASAAGLRGLARLAHRLAPAAWRAVVLRPLAAGALAVPVLVAPTASPLTSAVAAADEAHEADDAVGDDSELDAEGPVITMTWGGAPASTGAAEPTPEPTTPPPTIVVAPPELADEPSPGPAPASPTAPPTHGGPVTPDAPATQAELPAPPPASTASSSTGISPEHVVAPGDSFWRIAEQHVAADLGREPSASETGTYWRRLVAANQDRLPVAGNPDLIYPGMRLVLPEA